MSAETSGSDTDAVVHAPQLRTFEIHGTFEAENLDDAFVRLGMHFADLVAEDWEAPERLGHCEIDVRPAR